MFTYPSQNTARLTGNSEKKAQNPAKPRPQSPFGLHRFSYTSHGSNVPQTTLSRTPSPNKEFRKVSSAQSNLPASPVPPQDTNASVAISSPEIHPRSISPGSVRSANTTHTFDTTALSVASEGNVNRDLSKWFQTSTKDPKLSFLQPSLVSVASATQMKARSRNSTPTRSLTNNAAFNNNHNNHNSSYHNNSTSSQHATSTVITSTSIVTERLSLHTPHAQSAWREQYQEVGRERVTVFMQEDNVDYLGLAELAQGDVYANMGDLSNNNDENTYNTMNNTQNNAHTNASIQRTTSGHSVYSNGYSSMYSDSGLTLEQKRSLKDAQDGIMSVREMGDVVLSNGSSVQQSESDLVQAQSEEARRRRQRRLLQLVRDFTTASASVGNTGTSSGTSSGSSIGGGSGVNNVSGITQDNATVLITNNTPSRHALITAAQHALTEALALFTAQLQHSKTALQAYESTLQAQNRRYFELQQQLRDSEGMLQQEGERNRRLLDEVKVEYRQASDRVGTSALQSVVDRYPVNWLHSEHEADAESTCCGRNVHTRARTNSNMSMSELSLYTTHPNTTHTTHHTHNTHLHNSGSRNLYTNTNNIPYTTTSSPRNSSANVLPDSASFSAPWVYNVNPTVATALASHATIGHRYYGPPSTDRRASSPNPLRATTNINNTNNTVHGTNTVTHSSESVLRPTSATRNRLNRTDAHYIDTSTPSNTHTTNTSDVYEYEEEVYSSSGVSRGRSRSTSNTTHANSRSNSRERSTSRTRSRSRSRSLGRYFSINGPAPPPIFAPPSPPRRATSAERNRRSSSGNGNGSKGTSGTSGGIKQAIHDLEASRHSLYTNTASSSARNTAYNNIHSVSSDNAYNIYSLSTGPVSLLKQAADAEALSQHRQYLNSGTRHTQEDLNIGTLDEEVNYGTLSRGAKVRRGSGASLHSMNSNVSHLSVSTGVLSAAQKPTHATNTTANISSNTTTSTISNSNTNNTVYNRNGRLVRSPPRSAASPRQNTTNTTTNTTNTTSTANTTNANRSNNMRRYSGATESTDANYSGTRYSDYQFSDIHSVNSGAISHVYDNSGGSQVYSGNVYSNSGGNNTQNVPNDGYVLSVNSYTTTVDKNVYDNSSVHSSSSNSGVHTDTIINGIRRPPPFYNTTNTTTYHNNMSTVTSPNANIDRSHISSSGSESGDSVAHNTKHNTTLNATLNTAFKPVNSSNIPNDNADNTSFRTGISCGSKNTKVPKVFNFDAVSYVDDMHINYSTPNTGTTSIVNNVSNTTNHDANTNITTNTPITNDTTTNTIVTNIANNTTYPPPPPYATHIHNYPHTEYNTAMQAYTQHHKSSPNTNTKKSMKDLPRWTLSKYKTDNNTTIGGTSGGNSGASVPRAQDPSLFVYRGKTTTDTTNTTNSVINDTANNTSNDNTIVTPRRANSATLRRTPTPKVRVPNNSEYNNASNANSNANNTTTTANNNTNNTSTNANNTTYHNAAQADMARYIESIRNMKY